MQPHQSYVELQTSSEDLTLAAHGALPCIAVTGPLPAEPQVSGQVTAQPSEGQGFTKDLCLKARSA